ncbi:MAG: flagellar hook assembly protein FlgD [Desulfovibrio sp.]|jgi:flagellar basal-body rod modification protein FlgD|nr:flagellar hook assembly protein FlgD [Desulfovibrio sp.]
MASAAITQANNEFNAAVAKQTGGDLDKNSFLLLLVTQFKYQDPLNPMEDKEFISQMSQFSSLEQLMNLNTSMEGLTAATNNSQLINATSYIGKSVTVAGYAVGKTTDAAGNATITRFRYAPADNVVSGAIEVLDANNNRVYYEDTGAKATGTTYEFNWDGKNNLGIPVADGVYTVSLTLKNAKGEAVLADQVVDAKVTGVVTDNGVVCLGLEGGQLVALADVRQVMEPKVVANNDTGNTGDAGNTGDTGTTP